MNWVKIGVFLISALIMAAIVHLFANGISLLLSISYLKGLTLAIIFFVGVIFGVAGAMKG